VGAFFASLIVVAIILAPAEKHGHKVSWVRIVLLVIPVLLGFIAPPDTEAMTQSANADQITQNVSSQPVQQQSTLVFSKDLSQDQIDEQLPEPLKKVRHASSFALDDEKFFSVVQDMYDNPAVYKGKHISFVGLVYHRKKSPANEMAVMRLMMTCCSADLQPVGLICNQSGASDWKDKTWVKIEGVLTSKESEQGELPIVVVDTIKQTEKPAQEYVYPL
jgi:putative membrane protein